MVEKAIAERVRNREMIIVKRVGGVEKTEERERRVYMMPKLASSCGTADPAASVILG